MRRRHVIYIAGYDPLGIAHYHRLFKREIVRAQNIWPVNVNITDPVMDPDGLAGHWQIETSGPNWQVSTTYEYLRWDDLIVRDMRMPFLLLFMRTIFVLIENIVTGTVFRIFRANWRFGIFYIVQPLGVLALGIAPPVLGILVVQLCLGMTALPSWIAAIVGGGATIASFFLIRAFINRWYVIQLAACWIWFRDWAHGRRAEFAVRLDEFARRIIARARANDVDELIVIGHSGGGTIGVPIVARALNLDPDFARGETPVTFLALGTSLPVAASHPKSNDVRTAIYRVATEPSIAWIDCQSRKDIINFYNFDMVESLGVEPGEQKCNPLIWQIRFRDIVSPELYERLRWNFHRMHFQFIMANDRRAPYDYFMFVCGPVRLLDWYRGRDATLAEFSDNVTYTPRQTVAAGK